MFVMEGEVLLIVRFIQIRLSAFSRCTDYAADQHSLVAQEEEVCQEEQVNGFWSLGVGCSLVSVALVVRCDCEQEKE